MVTDVCQVRQARGTDEEWKAVRSHKEGAIGGAIPGTNHLRDSAAKGLGVNAHGNMIQVLSPAQAASHGF